MTPSLARDERMNPPTRQPSVVSGDLPTASNCKLLRLVVGIEAELYATLQTKKLRATVGKVLNCRASDEVFKRK